MICLSWFDENINIAFTSGDKEKQLFLCISNAFLFVKLRISRYILKTFKGENN